MSNVAIVTDSTNCLPKDLIREYDIRIAPSNMTINNKNYRDEIDINPAQFWQMLPALDKLPTLSGPGPGDFVYHFNELAGQTGEVLVIGMSRAFSVTCFSAERARESVQSDFPDLKIEILDSRSSMGALGFIVLEAARAAKQEKSLADVLQTAKDMIPRVKHYTGMHSLKYLSHSGRLPKSMLSSGATGGQGSLDTKTVISVNRSSGQIELVGKFPDQPSAMEAMISGAKAHLDLSRPAHFMVHYSIDLGEVEELKKMVLDNFNCAEFYVTQCTAVMTCATGPQFGISFYS
jgi:DegV family protein with EDD domain